MINEIITDAHKAVQSLNWAIGEMNRRYTLFEQMSRTGTYVVNLDQYNEQLEKAERLPKIVIIIDELADLMLAAKKEMEERIQNLTQKARAAGIHLIIATQRPSVDVITGLIKANMPSRVAFSVSSGVDSRTILDMNGAEKLLGKGDMLFYPQGYSKPARVQGAFVSDREVSDVVDFLKNQAIGNVYAEDIEEKIKTMSSSSGGSTSGAEGDDSRDEYFAEAGRFIIEKDKASIGMLQRMFKIGFNRAARIMDQLCDYGVVGEEEGTKPRKILMSMEQFEQLLEEI
jgi:S-DNA-T family DNA segregation ATPase FtsK/SpoIIIE